jgi:hypothetical protein
MAESIIRSRSGIRIASTKPRRNGPHSKPGTAGNSLRQADSWAASSSRSRASSVGRCGSFAGSRASRHCTAMNSPRGSPWSVSQSA